jgi:hypothetical protein
MVEFDIKKAGLNIAEDTVKNVITNIVKPYAAYYAAKSENKIDDILIGFLDQLEGALLSVADKIDGEVG